tara:strand:- start:335 stop:886 length:552 start_codon:yes stop_codon:yes gene_type:complete
MADLIIKPASTSDSFKFKDANSSPNTVLTVEGQTDSGVTTAGRVIYGKGVNETKGTASQASAVITIDLATGTFFEHEITQAVTTWKILHLPASGTIAAWVVKIAQPSSKIAATAIAYTGDATSTYDNGSAFVAVTNAPVFHWAYGSVHILSDTNSAKDIVSFFTYGGDDPVIYSTEIGKGFAT